MLFIIPIDSIESARHSSKSYVHVVCLDASRKTLCHQHGDIEILICVVPQDTDPAALPVLDFDLR